MKQAKKIWNGVNVKIRDFLASLCFSGPSFLGMLMFFVAPFCVVIYYSFIAGALDHSFVGLKNYINVWNNGAFQIAVKNTAVFSGLSVPLAVVLALVLPIYTLGGLVLTAAVSAGAYFAGTKLCPTRVVRTYVPYATGSEDVDTMLNGIAANLDGLHKLNEAIPDPQLSRAMDRMEKAGRSIAAVVEKTPDKARSVDRFARYYLPEVVKLMGTYAALEQNGVRGENAAQIEAELRRNAETTATAFENQLDALYSAEAMDISTDIEVLDSILKSQNLAK